MCFQIVYKQVVILQRVLGEKGKGEKKGGGVTGYARLEGASNSPVANQLSDANDPTLSMASHRN